MSRHHIASLRSRCSVRKARYAALAGAVAAGLLSAQSLLGQSFPPAGSGDTGYTYNAKSGYWGLNTNWTNTASASVAYGGVGGGQNVAIWLDSNVTGATAFTVTLDSTAAGSVSFQLNSLWMGSTNNGAFTLADPGAYPLVFEASSNGILPTITFSGTNAKGVTVSAPITLSGLNAGQALTFDTAVTMPNGSANTPTANALTLTGAVSGTGDLFFNELGALNFYANINNSGNVYVATNVSTFTLTGVNQINNIGAVSFSNSSGVTINGGMGCSGSISFKNTGGVTIVGQIESNSTVSFNNGNIVNIESTAALGNSGDVTFTNNGNVTNSGNLDNNGNVIFGNTGTVNIAAGSLNNNGNDTFNNTSTVTILGSINNSGALAFNNGGAVYLSNTASWPIGTSFSSVSFSPAGNVQTVGTITNSGNMTFNTAGISIGGQINNSGTFTTTGNASNTAALTNSNVIGQGAGATFAVAITPSVGNVILDANSMTNTGGITIDGEINNSGSFTNNMGGSFYVGTQTGNTAVNVVGNGVAFGSNVGNVTIAQSNPTGVIRSTIYGSIQNSGSFSLSTSETNTNSPEVFIYGSLQNTTSGTNVANDSFYFSSPHENYFFLGGSVGSGVANLSFNAAYFLDPGNVYSTIGGNIANTGNLTFGSAWGHVTLEGAIQTTGNVDIANEGNFNGYSFVGTVGTIVPLNIPSSVVNLSIENGEIAGNVATSNFSNVANTGNLQVGNLAICPLSNTTIFGALSSSGNVVVDSGILNLSGTVSNLNNGTITLNGGELILNLTSMLPGNVVVGIGQLNTGTSVGNTPPTLGFGNSNSQISLTSIVTIPGPSAGTAPVASVMDLNGNNQTIGYLQGGGYVGSSSGPSTLTLSPATSDNFNGSIVASIPIVATVSNTSTGAVKLNYAFPQNVAVVIAGTGLQTLSGDNSYAGGTFVSPGASVQAGGSAALGFGGIMISGEANALTTVTSGATLDLNAQNITQPILISSATLTNNGSGRAILTNNVLSTSFSGASSNFASSDGPTYGGGNGSGAAVAITEAFTTASFQIINPGAGYTGKAATTATINNGTNVLITGTITPVTNSANGGEVSGLILTFAGDYTPAQLAALIARGTNAITIGGGGTGVTTIATAEIVDNNFALIGMQQTNAGSGYTSAPTLSLNDTNGASATLTTTLGTLTLAGNNTISGTGDIEIDSAISGTGTFNKTGTNNLILTNELNRIPSGLTISGGGLAAQPALGAFGYGSVLGSGSNAGAINLNGGRLAIYDDGAASGTSNATLAYGNDINVLAGASNTLSVNPSSLGSGNTIAFGSLALSNNASLALSSTGGYKVSLTGITGGGTLSGNAPVTVTGRIQPGDAPAILNASNLGFSSASGTSATLAALITGSGGSGGTSNAGIKYDQINMTGSSALAFNGSTLDLLTASYTPTTGDDFFILVNGSNTTTATFGQVEFNNGSPVAPNPDGSYSDPLTAGSVEYVIDYQGVYTSGALSGGQDVVVEVEPAVPEPGSLGLIGLGVTSLLIRRRSRRTPKKVD